ncbi:MAG: hypothetical protein KGH63_01090 [Candidatus Micrarchaeota archaeon]|nr:hypothetical protein [Candidatus Micrarchaeota archaeon]
MSGLQKAKDFFFGGPQNESRPEGPEPSLGPLTAPIGIPGLGPVRAYYLLLVAILVLFILTKNALVGLLGGLTILFIVAWEFYCGFKAGGIGSEIRETAIAILIALVIWFGSGFLLNTSTPINAIVSCSMLPTYERGDLVILQGAPIATQYVPYAGPASDVNSTAIITYQGQNEVVDGSMLAHCANAAASGGAGGPASGADAWCPAFLQTPQAFVETHGPVVIHYGACPRYYPATGQTRVGICATSLSVAGQSAGAIGQATPTPVPFNASHELLVYTPAPGELYSQVGDIVHRAAFALNTTTGIVYFSKGDNNPIYDFQAYDQNTREGNNPIHQSQIKGKVIARVPYLGNLKLFITPQVLVGGATAGCDSYYIH